MTNKINMVINLSILALLIYLSVAIKKIEDKVFPDPNVMIPLASQTDARDQLEYNMMTFLNNAFITNFAVTINKKWTPFFILSPMISSLCPKK